jgi:anaerobic magnesium-protoporphyrin IX monomethyl ester cyclase
MNNSIDVLLTYPSDGLRLFQSMIPTGLISIGTVLRNAGYTVKIIDFNHYSNDFRRDLQRMSPKVVGIGGTTPSRMGSFLTSRIVKNIFPQIPVVYGGVHASFTAVNTLRNIETIDYIIQGEGELSFLTLCDILTGKINESISSVSGLVWRQNTAILENKPERINDLSLLPIPDRTLTGNDYDLKMEFTGKSGDFIMTSRGCPAACNFCAASRMFPGGVRTRPISSVMNEVELLMSTKHIDGLKIFDSTFTANREHVEHFCKSIKEFNIPWECEIRADTVDRELLKLMRASGCYYINIGMETINEEHLKKIAKGISSEQVLDVLEVCKGLDIRSKVFFTFGHLNQTVLECKQDIDFIKTHKRKIDFFGVTVGLRIYPGTRLEREYTKNAKEIDWSKPVKRFVEPGDVPVLFQKQLGPVKLSYILLILLKNKLVCTEKFLARMAIENALSVVKVIALNIRYTRHRIERLINPV